VRGQRRHIPVVAVVERLRDARVGVGGHDVQPRLVARDDVRQVVESDDVTAHPHEVPHGLAAVARDALGERSAVGVGVDGDHAVVASIGQRHTEQRRHGRLADAALAGQDGYEPRAAGERGGDAAVELFARPGALAVSEVDPAA
jgi:hypothetical protein